MNLTDRSVLGRNVDCLVHAFIAFCNHRQNSDKSNSIIRQSAATVSSRRPSRRSRSDFRGFYYCGFCPWFTFSKSIAAGFPGVETEVLVMLIWGAHSSHFSSGFS